MERSAQLKEFYVAVFCALVAVNIRVSAEKTGWLCESAFSNDIPAVFFTGQKIIDACISMRNDLLNKNGKGNENFRSCTLLPDRQCIASR